MEKGGGLKGGEGFKKTVKNVTAACMAELAEPGTVQIVRKA